MIQDVTECRCLIYGMQENVTKYNGIKLPYSPNVTDIKAATSEYYEMIYKVIWAPTFRNILIHFVN